MPRPKPKVVLLLQELKFGGTQRQALELAAGLSGQGFAPEIWTMMAGHDFLPEAKARGITIRILGRSSYVWPDALLRLARTLGREKPDILYMLTGIPNIWGRLLGRFAGAAVLVGSWRGEGCPGRQFEALFWPLAGHFICNANMLKDRMVNERKIPAERISVVPNGVDTRRFSPAETKLSGQEILCPARLVAEKDPQTLILAFSRIAADYPQAGLSLCGDGPLRGALLKLVSNLGLPDRVKLLPATSNLERLYAASALVALSSKREGLPNVLLEAMASGLPVLSTRAGGVSEAIDDGIEGVLVEPGDVSGLARGLARLLPDPDLRARMGLAGRARVLRDYSLEGMVRAHAEIFTRLLASRGITPK